MQLVMGLVLLVLCAMMVQYARPDATGISRAPFGSEGGAVAAIMVVTVLGSFGVLLMVFWATGIEFAG